MTRVTPTEVKEIVVTSLADPAVQQWIDCANSIVNSKSSCIGGDEVLLTKIELQLSAHFVAMLDPATRGFVTKENIARQLETDYSSPVALVNALDNTTYGTTANMLSGGCLSQLTSAKATVEFF